jgi:ankyrin repeat protein
MSTERYNVYELFTMNKESLKEELLKELKKDVVNKEYIDDILGYGDWGSSNKQTKKIVDPVIKAFRVFHKTTKQPLLRAIEESYGASVVKTILNDSSVNPNVQTRWGETPLILASRLNNLKVVRELLKHPDINPNLADYGLGDTPLTITAQIGNLAIARELLKHPKTDPNITTQRGESPLNIAAQYNSLSVIRELLKHPKTDPNLLDMWSDTALHNAAHQENIESVKEILNHPKCDPNVTFYSKFRYGSKKTALMVAAKGDSHSIIREILNHPKCNPNLQDEEGWTALMWAANYFRNASITELLKHPNINIDLKDNDGKTVWEATSKEIRKKFPELDSKRIRINQMTELLKEVSHLLPKDSKELKEIQAVLE